jgi:hypothetical protein
MGMGMVKWWQIDETDDRGGHDHASMSSCLGALIIKQDFQVCC